MPVVVSSDGQVVVELWVKSHDTTCEVTKTPSLDEDVKIIISGKLSKSGFPKPIFRSGKLTLVGKEGPPFGLKYVGPGGRNPADDSRTDMGWITST